MNDIEQDIRDAGADKAPRITPESIEANIASEHYFTAADGADGACLTEARQGDPYESVEFKPLAEDNQKAGTPMAALDLLTICVLVLRNGFTIVGKSACASPENFNAEIGKKIARQDAVEQIGPFMGYELRSRLAGG